jgi:hypothetical protein
MAGAQANVCSLEAKRCDCGEESEDRRRRCEGLAPIFENAGSHCVAVGDSASCEAELNHGYCEWKGVVVDNVVQGKCVTSICWLKFQHTLAACPEFWPNITAVGPDSWADSSGTVCSHNCAVHFASFYRDIVCMEWLDDLVLCDRSGLRPTLHHNCAPKPAMREDMEGLAAHCIELAEHEDILNMFITAAVVGLIVALCGHFIAKQIRKSEKLEMEDVMLEQERRMERNDSDATVTGETTHDELE